MANNQNTHSSGGFMFGQPSATSQSAQTSSTPAFSLGASTGNSSIFGSTGTQKPLFGAASTTQGSGSTTQSGSTSLFGSLGGSTGGTAFGSNADSGKPAGSTPLFAGFGTPGKAPATNATPSSQTTSIFGGTPTTTSDAAAAPAGSTTPASTKPLFSLGNPSTTPAGPPPSSQSGGLFNFASPAASPQPAAGSLFGHSAALKPSDQSASSAATPASNMFGSKPATNPTTQSTTAAPSAPSSGGASNTGGTSLFGNPGKPQSQPSTTPSAATTQPGTSNAPKPAFSFPPVSSTSSQQPLAAGTPKPGAEDAPKPSPFSSAAQSKPAASSPFTLGAPKAAEPKTSSSEAPPANMFGNLGAKPAPSTSSAAPSGATTTTSLPGATLTASSFPTSQTPATSQAPSQPAASTGNAFAPSATTTAATLGSSTGGPAPSAQSRLKNKSMDEIITRWASDLSKYQKEFQGQAEQVASWDRMLVENGSKISKLYSKTFQAERDMAEVERQLTAVEGQQDELATYLDRYEKEVDEMLARQVGQGEGLQGPDQERERTYKTAEKVSERLNEMGKDLTSMIEEINTASAAISKSNKPDDPLSQIVRVLNSHLSQLQVIDQGAAALQAKVTAAQKDSQRLTQGRQGGFGNGNADDFFRSYMSRG